MLAQWVRNELVSQKVTDLIPIANVNDLICAICKYILKLSMNLGTCPDSSKGPGGTGV